MYGHERQNYIIWGHHVSYYEDEGKEMKNCYGKNHYNNKKVCQMDELVWDYILESVYLQLNWKIITFFGHRTEKSVLLLL
jgi:hypothetical protein